MPITPFVQERIDARNAASIDIGSLMLGGPGSWVKARW